MKTVYFQKGKLTQKDLNNLSLAFKLARIICFVANSVGTDPVFLSNGVYRHFKTSLLR